MKSIRIILNQTLMAFGRTGQMHGTSAYYNKYAILEGAIMPATPINVVASDGLYKDGVLVTWSYPEPIKEPLRWDIYRWRDGEPPRFYYSVFGNTLSFPDYFNVFGFTQDKSAKYNYAVAAYSYTGGLSALSTSDVGYIAPNTSPVFEASNYSLSIDEDYSGSISVYAKDADGDPLTYSIYSAAKYGYLNLNGNVVTYRPIANFNGSDSFVIRVSDGRGGLATQTVNVTVNSVNDAPYFISSNNKLIAKPATQTIFRVSALDVDADKLTYSIAGGVSGNVTINGNVLSYTPPASGGLTDTFEVIASDSKGGSAKQVISVTIGNSASPSPSLAPLSGSNAVDMMLNGYKWNGSTIYYSMSQGFSGEYFIDPSKTRDDLVLIFNLIGLYLGVNFEFVGYFPSPDLAAESGSNINISLDTKFMSSSTYAVGIFPNVEFAKNYLGANYYKGAEGDIFLNLNSGANALTYEPGSEGFFLLLHEIGHALGLKHPHDDGGSGRPTFTDLKVSSWDIDWMTIMSYNDGNIYDFLRWDPTTPMILDVIALQYLYGASKNGSGDNIWTVSFDFPTYLTLFDSAGYDVLDFSNASQGARIELPSYRISELQLYPIGIALPESDLSKAYPTYLTWLYGTFEEVRGSQFNDNIFGTNLRDKVFGNRGNDSFSGGGEDDFFDGEGGIDTAYFVDFFADCLVSFSAEQCIVTTKTEGVDRLVSVEYLVFGPLNNRVTYKVADLLNKPPLFSASILSISTREDNSVNFSAAATDPDGDPLVYSITTIPGKGGAVVANGVVTYAPARDFNGADSFVLSVSDGRGGIASQTINVTVTSVNDAPVFGAANQAVFATAGTAKTISLFATDVDGDALTYTTATPGKVNASIAGNTLTYTPGAGAWGTDSFVVTSSDGKGGTATQTINVTVLAATATKAFTVTTLPGWVGSIGGNGSVVGSNGFEDVTVLFGQIALDGSFNRGGDIVRVSGNADSYLIGRTSASNAYIEAETSKVTIPIGSTGMGIVFGDGVRKLGFASGAYKIGSQTFTADPGKITSTSDGTALPTGADPAAQAIVTMLTAGLSGGKAPDLTITGKARIVGTNGVDVIKVGSTGGELVFDGSFNRGGDIIVLNKAAGDYSAAKFNASTIVITSGIEKLTIPMGTTGMTLRFTDGDRTLVFKSGAFYIGEQAFTATTATQLTPSAITLSADQGLQGSSVILNATGKAIITDDATKTSNVIVKSFGSDDVIRVTGATASQYNFAISDADPKDLEITYTDAATSATNRIVLDDVIKVDAFIANYQTAATALGWNFMTFG